MTDLQALFDLTGLVAVVTGGSRGLGLEIATGLGEAGARVAITARREAWLKTAQETLRDRGIESLALTCDGADPAQADAAVSQVMARFGRADILVNNAGVSWASPAESMPLDQWRRVLDTNATGCFVMSQRVGREMIAAGRGGAIVNVASIAGIVGTSAEVLDAIGYAASKGAVIAFTRDLAVKWAPFGIRVNAIAPGFFETRLTTGVLEKSRGAIEHEAPLGRIGQPGELKGAVVFLASAAASYITGQVLAVDGGTTAR